MRAAHQGRLCAGNGPCKVANHDRPSGSERLAVRYAAASPERPLKPLYSMALQAFVKNEGPAGGRSNKIPALQGVATANTSSN